MASGTANRAYHSTITAANTVEKVTLDINFEMVQVINRSGTSEIYWTTNPSMGPNIGVAAADSFVSPAVIGFFPPEPNLQADANVCEVWLISAGTPTYSVIGVSPSPVSS